MYVIYNLMEVFKAFDERQNKLVNEVSSGPGLYQVNKEVQAGEVVFPWAPGNNTSLQGYGVDSQYVDIESELNNLSRPLSKTPAKHYNPMDKFKGKSVFGQDGFFHGENTSLVNNPLDMKEFGINRFEWPQIDPQANAIEPFIRIGDNSVLMTLDNHKTFCK